jgi:Tfp pilus assembly protein PilF
LDRLLISFMAELILVLRDITMKCCHRCNTDWPDSYNYCMKCETALSMKPAADGAPYRCSSCGAQRIVDGDFCEHCREPLKEPKFDLLSQDINNRPRVLNASGGTNVRAFEPDSVRSPKMEEKTETTCGECGVSIGLGRSYCESCSSNLESLKGSPIPGRTGAYVAFTTAMFLIAILAFGIWSVWIRDKSTESKLDEAIAKGVLLRPSGKCAYDYYLELKQSHKDAKIIARFNEKLYPLIMLGPQKMLSEIMTPTNKEPSAGDWEDAHKLLQWANEIRPNDSRVIAREAYCSGRVAYLSQDKGMALASWEQAANADKTWALSSNGIGLIYNERQEYEQARQHLFEAIRRDPGWAYPYNNLGTGYYYEKRYDLAEKYYRLAVDRAPGWARPHLWLGNIAVIRKDYSQAIQEYEKALEFGTSETSNLDFKDIRAKLQKAHNMLASRNVTTN